MENNVMKETTDSPEFKKWLTGVTTTGFEMGHHIDVHNYLEVLALFFVQKSSPDLAVKQYLDVERRLLAINGEWKMKVFDKMLEYGGKYQISIQFWGNDCTNVFIEKDGVHLTDFGGLTPGEAIHKTKEYLDRINRKS